MFTPDSTIDSLSMGWPLNPLLVNFLLVKLENGPPRYTISHLTSCCRCINLYFYSIRKRNMKRVIYFIHLITFTHPLLPHFRKNSVVEVRQTRKLDGTLKGRMHRKSAVEQYAHFYSTVPIRYKRKLVNNLKHRARMICPDDTIVNEVSNICNLLSRNGHPTKFINQHIVLRRVNVNPKKVLFLKSQS